jgi:hypothetical protein
MCRPKFDLVPRPSTSTTNRRLRKASCEKLVSLRGKLLGFVATVVLLVANNFDPVAVMEFMAIAEIMTIALAWFGRE